MLKRWVKIAAGVAGLLVLVALSIPFFVHADTFRPTIEDQLSRALGRQITLGHLSLSVFKGSLVAENITIADDAAFSPAPFLQAKSFAIGVEMAPLIFHKQVRITSLVLDAPSVNLIHGENSKWNFSSIGGASPSTPGQQTALPDLTVGEFKIKDGTATVSSMPAVGKPFVYSGINLTVKQLSFLKSFPFELEAKLPANGTLNLSGNAGPLAQKNAADTPFRATLKLKQFDPVAAGVIDASQGLSMVLDVDADAASDGTTLTSSGKLSAARLKLSRGGAATPKPVNVQYSVQEDLDTSAGKINDIALKTGAVAAHVSGGFKLTPQSAILDLTVNAPGLPIDELEELLPAVGVTLPTGSQLRGGTLSAHLGVKGPATAPTISGPIEIDNTKLAGFDLGTKIQGLNPFGGKGGGTDIQVLRTSVISTPQTTQFNDIYGNLPQLGTATGSGSVAASGTLDFKMVATLTSSNAVGAVANQAINAVSSVTGNVSGLIGGFMHPKQQQQAAAPKGNKGIPITITGTAANPSIRANLVSMLK